MRAASIRAVWVAFLLAALGLAPAAGATSATPLTTTAPAPAPAPLITIKDFGFRPDHLTVAPGALVTVVNTDDAPHTVTGTGTGPAAFGTGTIRAGDTTTLTAPRNRGTYTYLCNIHQFMSATLVVR
ncbi:cupredoxin domain-containing protein [Streptomyces sp. NPDC048507]|uniref:cupredoxin domain-containing protein n=1 Tax=Streptomyces sp. NPDC048507 TaxID=3365560 RepID=UPI003722AFA6